MNGMDLLEGVNGMDEELLSPSVEKSEARRPKKLFWAAVAAAALFVCGCMTAGAAAIVRGKFGPERDGANGYSAKFELNKFKWREFTGDISETPEIIREQYLTFTPAPVLSSVAVHPGSYAKSFASLKEAADYIGLSALKAGSLPFSEDVTVGVSGDSEGRIREVDISSQHILMPGDPGGFGYFLHVTILTEHNPSSAALTGGSWGDYDPGRIEYNEFTSSKGVLCQYAEVGVGDRTRQMVSGYIVDNGILYNLSMNFDEGRLDRAIEMLKAWAESF